MLSSWMILGMYLPQVIFSDMSIDLGGRNIDMAQHDLNGPQVSAAFQQMSGKRVSQTVGCKFFFNS